jgi:hypothetical protein
MLARGLTTRPHVAWREAAREEGREPSMDGRMHGPAAAECRHDHCSSKVQSGTARPTMAVRGIDPK